MSHQIFGDFTSPCSWLASLRADALLLAGVDVQWRAVVEHHSIWVTPQPIDASRQKHFAELQEWHRTSALPGEPAAPAAPATTPWPDPAVAGYAEAVGAGVADHVRHLIFTSYWRDEADIGNLEVLRHLLTVPILHGNSDSEVLSETGDAIAINGGPYTSGACRRIRQWRQEWEALGCPPLPALVEGTATRVGLQALDRLGAIIKARHATIPTANPFPLPRMPLPARRVSHDRPGLRPCWWDG